MELLAFVHNAVNYEDPTPDPQVRLFDGSRWQIPSSAWMGLASFAVVLAAVGYLPQAAMAAPAAISPGSSGKAVEAVQQALGIEVDGQYGPKTAAAVTDFQIRQGLNEIDGVVGKETASALGLDEQYRPVALGVVDTYSGWGLNVRTGPGLDYRRIGGAPNGAELYTDGYDYVYRDGYRWEPVADGAWVATDYLSYDGGVPEAYRHDYYYEESGYYEDCSDYYYDEQAGYGDYAYVETNTGIGLNVRSGPGLGYHRVGGLSDYSDVYTDSYDVYYNPHDGYTWQQLGDGSWVASDYLNYY